MSAPRRNGSVTAPRQSRAVTAPRWRPRRAGLAVLLGLLAGAVAAPGAGWAEPALSVTGLRQEPGLAEFFLSARDLPAGQRLDPASVSVAVDGRPLELRGAARVAGAGTRAPRRLTVLILDTSGSMQGRPLSAAREAAAGYASGLPDDVDVAIVTAGTPARTLLAPTADRAKVASALEGLTTGGETALYDGLDRAAGLVDDAERYTARRVVVLSDGADTASTSSLSGARRRLIAARTPVDTVAFRTEETTAEVLAELSADTGGRAYTARDSAALAGAFRSAAGAFTVQLLVTVVIPADLGGERTRLEVSAAAGATTVRTSMPVTLAVDPHAAAPLARVSTRGLSPLQEGGLVVAVFVGGLAVALLAVSPLLDVTYRRRRLAQLDHFTVVARPAPSTTAAEAGNPVAVAALALSRRMVQVRGLEGRIAARLDEAGMRLRPHEWLLLRGLASLVAGIVLTLFVGPLLGLPTGALIAWVATGLYQRHRAARRVQAFATQLPDALQLVIGSLRSGFSLSQAIDAMVRELPDPISTEFGRVLGEARLGVQLEDALDRLAVRMRSTDLGWAVVAVRVQREVGSNLAEILATTVSTMRARDALRRHVQALSAEGRLSAWILLALPVAVALFMFVFRREYLRPLYTEPLGLLMSLTGVGLVAAGAFWLSRVVKVEI